MFVDVAGHRLEVVRLAPARPRPAAPMLVFLHEGLGSIAMWRDFPQRVADATGGEAVVYSRYGYGRSTPLASPHGVDYMHREALRTLPALLRALDIRHPVLFGHSDGASIALIHAGAAHDAGDPFAPRGVIAMAPHVFVEDISVRSIAQTRDAYRDTGLRAKLARYHDDVDSAFRGWNDIWLHPDFRTWNIEACLPAIACPVLALQGEDDEYGTMEQVRAIARATPGAQLLALPRCGHSPHRDQPDAVISAVTAFLERLEGAGGPSPHSSQEDER